MGFYEFARGVTRGFCKVAYHITFEGLEHIPIDGGYVLCSNHRSYLDPVFVGIRLKQRLHFMAKKELFRNKFFGALISKLGAFPVEKGKDGGEAIEKAEAVIRDRKVFAIFPEGTRSKTGELLRLRSGALVVAAQTGADILPVTVNFQGKLRFRTRVVIRYGEMIPHEKLGLTEASPKQLRQANKLLTETMLGLLHM